MLRVNKKIQSNKIVCIYLVLVQHQLSILLGVHLIEVMNTVVMCNCVLHILLLTLAAHARARVIALGLCVCVCVCLSVRKSVSTVFLDNRGRFELQTWICFQRGCLDGKLRLWSGEAQGSG